MAYYPFFSITDTNDTVPVYNISVPWS